MPKVEIKTNHYHPAPGGVGIWIDGVEQKDVRDIRVNFSVDAVPTVTVESYLTEGEFTFEANVDRHLHIHVPEGTELRDVTPPGVIHPVYRVVPKV